jgi:hypothetical protein
MSNYYVSSCCKSAVRIINIENEDGECLECGELCNLEVVIINNMKKIDSEKISKLGWFVYIKLFDDIGCEEFKDYQYFQDGKNEYDCKRIFWRFYWIINEEKLTNS